MQSSERVTSATFVIVGGGIAGVTCAETIAICCPTEPIILLTESNLIKTITNLEPLTKYLYKFNVQERNVNETSSPSNICAIVDTMLSIESSAKRIHTLQKRILSYQYLCICTGGRPKIIESNNPRVLGIRDTDSVLELQDRIKTSRRLVLVGNGGIASELAYEIRNIDVHWVIKNEHITSTFIDAGAAHFFQHSRENHEKSKTVGPVKRLRYDEISANYIGTNATGPGAALGPDWHRKLNMIGTQKNSLNSPKIYYNAHIQSIKSHDLQQEFPLQATLSTGTSIDCDFLVSATGVEARLNFSCDQTLALSDNGFILVDSLMETNIPSVYAAGDICCANWETSKNWFQMRLWTQARQMGAMAGRSMVASFRNEKIYQDFCFELFGHVTELFGFEVILLGCFNGQGLDTNYEILLRTTPGVEYIKFVLSDGKLRGAILIGNTELGETCENLILNEIDLTPFGEDILNPDIDIEDYFD